MESKAQAHSSALHAIILQMINSYIQDGKINLNAIKNQVNQQYNLQQSIKNMDILAAVPPNWKSILGPYLKTKPIRSASGVAVVAVMSKPHRCPHIDMTGNICVYCPGGPDSDFEYSTQSYTGFEPTSMRAIRARYDPFIQTRTRLTQLQRLGHSTDKVEFIIMGGTFMSLPREYRDSFVQNLHDALTGHRSTSIQEAVKYAAQSKIKCVGLTIETRPDYCLRSHINDMLLYGCTRLEVGVQSVYEDVARDTNRGHTVKAVSHCFHISKDAGYKIVCHMMPDLPQMDFDRDLEGFVELFENPEFRPDGLKIYPTLVIRGTGLYELWKTGRYKSYAPETLIDLLAKVLTLVPPWTRVYRIQRDIPMPQVSSSAVKKGNIRQYVQDRMHEFGETCRDIRSREVGISELTHKIRPEHVELVRRDYYGNGGWETFLAYEDPDQDILIGMLRLRKLSENTYRTELLGNNCSMIRELHVYGTAIAVNTLDTSHFQHKGVGALLVSEAEKIAYTEHFSDKMAIIAGIGTRAYYDKLGYSLEGVYMVKSLT